MLIQPEKALLPIVLIVEESLSVEMFLQFANASVSIDKAPSSNITFEILLLFLNNLAGTLTTFEPIVTVNFSLVFPIF